MRLYFNLKYPIVTKSIVVSDWSLALQRLWGEASPIISFGDSPGSNRPGRIVCELTLIGRGKMKKWFGERPALTVLKAIGDPAEAFRQQNKILPLQITAAVQKEL